MQSAAPSASRAAASHAAEFRAMSDDAAARERQWRAEWAREQAEEALATARRKATR